MTSFTPSDFEKIDKIGEGSFGVVYKGRNKKTGQTVAVKIIDLESTEDEIEDIQKEIHVLRQCLGSTNIVKVHGSFMNKTELWIVMEHMSGGSVYDLMRTPPLKGYLSEKYIAIILRDVLHGLVYLHDGMRTLHRDIKAANILIDGETGTSKLADFGVVGHLSQKSLKCMSFVGTPYWMAPEVIKQAGYSIGADIWSLGITAIEMAKGFPPFHRDEPMKALFLIPKNEPPRLQGEHFTKPFKEFVELCLQKDPNKRPPARELLKHKFIKTAKKRALITELIQQKELHASTFGSQKPGKNMRREEKKKESNTNGAAEWVFSKEDKLKNEKKEKNESDSEDDDSSTGENSSSEGDEDSEGEEKDHKKKPKSGKEPKGAEDDSGSEDGIDDDSDEENKKNKKKNPDMGLSSKQEASSDADKNKTTKLSHNVSQFKNLPQNEQNVSVFTKELPKTNNSPAPAATNSNKIINNAPKDVEKDDDSSASSSTDSLAKTSSEKDENTDDEDEDDEEAKFSTVKQSRNVVHKVEKTVIHQENKDILNLPIVKPIGNNDMLINNDKKVEKPQEDEEESQDSESSEDEEKQNSKKEEKEDDSLLKSDDSDEENQKKKMGSFKLVTKPKPIIPIPEEKPIKKEEAPLIEQQIIPTKQEQPSEPIGDDSDDSDKSADSENSDEEEESEQKSFASVLHANDTSNLEFPTPPSDLKPANKLLEELEENYQHPTISRAFFEEPKQIEPQTIHNSPIIPPIPIISPIVNENLEVQASKKQNSSEDSDSWGESDSDEEDIQNSMFIDPSKAGVVPISAKIINNNIKSNTPSKPNPDNYDSLMDKLESQFNKPQNPPAAAVATLQQPKPFNKSPSKSEIINTAPVLEKTPSKNQVVSAPPVPQIQTTQLENANSPQIRAATRSPSKENLQKPAIAQLPQQKNPQTPPLLQKQSSSQISTPTPVPITTASAAVVLATANIAATTVVPEKKDSPGVVVANNNKKESRLSKNAKENANLVPKPTPEEQSTVITTPPAVVQPVVVQPQIQQVPQQFGAPIFKNVIDRLANVMSMSKSGSKTSQKEQISALTNSLMRLDKDNPGFCSQFIFEIQKEVMIATSGFIPPLPQNFVPSTIPTSDNGINKSLSFDVVSSASGDKKQQQHAISSSTLPPPPPPPNPHAVAAEKSGKKKIVNALFNRWKKKVSE